jgi:hypothetical protein
LLLTWLSLSGLNLNSARYDRELRALDDFSIFQQKLATLSGDEPGQTGLARVADLPRRQLYRSFLTRNLCLSRSRIAPFNVCSTWSQASIFEPARSTGSPTSIVS